MVSAGNNRERLLFGVPQADDALVDLTSHQECTPEAHALPVLSRLPPVKRTSMLVSRGREALPTKEGETFAAAAFA